MDEGSLDTHQWLHLWWPRPRSLLGHREQTNSEVLGNRPRSAVTELLTLFTLEAGRWTLADHHGQIVLVNFRAT